MHHVRRRSAGPGDLRPLPSSCAGLAAPPATIGQWNGPTQAYTFIVPNAEYTGGQTSISADEAYYAFGDGTTNPVTFNGATEWNVPAQFFLRPKTKSTLVSTAFNIHLTATQMTDVLVDGGTADGRQLLAASSDVLNGVKGSTSAQAIGILGDEIYDANRGAGVKVLAFKAFGQTHAFYPDSTETAFDKQNIRDGHYTLWSPTVYIAPIAADAGAGAEPSNATVKYIVDTVLGNPGASAPDGGVPIDGLKATATVGLTPACAMQVQRTGDGAPLTAYTPAAPCTCKFLHDIVGGAPLPASCTTCTTSANCTGGLGCFNGFCETAPLPSRTRARRAMPRASSTPAPTPRRSTRPRSCSRRSPTAGSSRSRSNDAVGRLSRRARRPGVGQRRARRGCAGDLASRPFFFSFSRDRRPRTGSGPCAQP